MSTRSVLVNEVFAAMRRLSTEIDGLDQRAANHLGINRTDLHLLDVLRSSGPLTARELAHAVGLTSGGLSIALDRLERLSYIRRSQHPGDRRSVVIEATDALEPFEAELFTPLARQIRKLLQGYTVDQLETIKHYLDNAADVTNATAR